MTAKHDSTDFWYTLLDTLYNYGLARDGLKQIDKETEEKLLAYFKTKVEAGVSDGQTALPPGFHDYYWRFSEEMQPKLRMLAEGVLETDPDNGGASIILAMAAVRDMNYDESLPFVGKALALVPKDPCINLLVIDEYRKHHGFFGRIIDEQEKVLIALENLFEWAKRQEDTLHWHYRDARHAYQRHRITPYAVYQRIKTFKACFETPEQIAQFGTLIEKCNILIKRCRALLPEAQAAFQKELLQESTNACSLDNGTPENIDFWDTYLDSLENRGLSKPWWELTAKVQEQLLDYFKARIEAGVVDGKTTLPPQLPEYVSRFPEAMLLELREFSEEVLEKHPDNGAAMKMLAIIVSDGARNKDLLLLFEQAMTLAPNDVETCFLALSHHRESADPLFELTLIALERLFERAKQQDESELYHWLAKLYKDVGITPCYIYRSLMKNPVENAELLARCKPLIVEVQHAFQQRLEQEPDDWYALRGLSDTYEALDETESAEKYPWTGHSEIRVVWDQKAWTGRKLPDFSTVAFDGTPVSFSDYRGKLVLLNFCAKWCGFCESEIPHIKEAYEQYHKDGFDVIGVSLDESEAELREFIQEHDIPWLQIFDGKGWESELARYFGINSVPSQWLIDRDGKILSVEIRGERLGQLIKWTERTRVGKVVPDFSTVSIDGEPVSLSAHRGKVVLLYFWTTGDYCEAEFTSVDTVYQKYHDNGFEVIGVNTGSWNTEEALRNYIREKGYIGQHIDDGSGRQGPLAQQFGLAWKRLSAVIELPAVVLIDTDGKVIEARWGKVYSTEAWGERLERLVAAHLPR